MRDLKVSRNVARAALSLPSSLGLRSNVCATFCLLSYCCSSRFRPRSTFQRNKSAVLCVNLKQPSIHQHLWIDVNNIKLGIDRTVLLRKG